MAMWLIGLFGLIFRTSSCVLDSAPIANVALSFGLLNVQCDGCQFSIVDVVLWFASLGVRCMAYIGLLDSAPD